MAELLLELLSEEIPARMQERAGQDLARLVGEMLATAGIAHAPPIRSFATPRRRPYETAAGDGRDESDGPQQSLLLS